MYCKTDYNVTYKIYFKVPAYVISVAMHNPNVCKCHNELMIKQVANIKINQHSKPN